MSAAERLSVEESTARGRDARMRIPRSGHATWEPRPDRRDPVSILAAQNERRLAWLVPVRHARMAVSPFTFYRGAAAVMAEDLGGTTNSGIMVQAGGDAHLSNFGAYASPSRELVFDANDFDETLPGPWEWDLKRLAASFVIGGQHLGFADKECRRLAQTVVRSYREAMAHYSKMHVLDLWYDYMDVGDVANFSGFSRKELQDRLTSFENRARSKTSLQALRKLTTRESGSLKIRSQPPLLVPLEELPMDIDTDAARAAVSDAYAQYVSSTGDHIQFLLSRFRIVDIAIKVVGVGSVGTRCWIILLEGRDDQDPLFLQIKEAMPSVLEDHLQPSVYDHQGRRVVEGQRLIQAQTDIFLGWTSGLEPREYYVRQLRDWKGSVEVDQGTPKQWHFYAALCARTLARGHARSGDATAIAAYAGTSSKLDDAIAEFSMRYAVQNLADYAAFKGAIQDGRLPIAESGT
ncbi:MAG: DUF2252 domain-containing protein [Actinobacteria bacterium]|nr:DUF2252 domain-containing protein [Actinomycetota bacterium]